MNVLTRVVEWFKRCYPKPTFKDADVQLGVHIEEIAELFVALRMYDVAVQLSAIATRFKTQEPQLLQTLSPEERVAVADALADIIWTATTTGAAMGIPVPAVFDAVVYSNYTKFDERGNPVFLEGGKIGKSKLYRKPVLDWLVNPELQIIGAQHCTSCKDLKRALDARGVPFVYKELEELSKSELDLVQSRHGVIRTIPCITHGARKLTVKECLDEFK